MLIAENRGFRQKINMDIQELRKNASQLGIDYDQATSKPVLIRAIQRHQGDTPCFATEQRYACKNFHCRWRRDCLKLIAEWKR
jgi:hypothetical protein